jgi:hypothetical protein
MKPIYAVLAVVAVVATVAAVVFAALYFTKGSASESTAAEQCENRTFGHISSLTREGEEYEMRFDPSLLTSGVTANTAAAEDGKVEPGEPVPNDNYEIDEGHRLLTYLVPEDAPVTVLTNDGTGIMSTPVTVSDLAELLDGGTPVALFEPLSTGFWIRYRVDTVCTLDQQYKP